MPRARSWPRRGSYPHLVPSGTVMTKPTAPCIAPPLDLPDAAQDDFRTRVMRLTCIAGLLGLPQISIPVGTARGCPHGLIAWAGGDEALLDLACGLSWFCGVVT
jgi:amidase